MEQLKNTIAKLKSDPLHAITVVNGISAEKIATNATGEILAGRYGSVENFFNDLNDQGVTLFQVFNKRKNGNTYGKDRNPIPNFKTIGLPFTVDARETQKPKTMKSETVHTPEVMQFNPFGMPLNGGLNMMDVGFKLGDHQRLENELRELKAKCEKLETENKILENTNLRNELSGDKASQNVELAKTFAPLLSPLLTKLLAPAGGGSLNSPAEYLSETKSELITNIKASDDTFNEYLMVVMQGISTNNEFTDELVALLEKYQLIQN